MDTTLAMYDNHDVKESLSSMVWKIQPASTSKSVVFYADKKHSADVFDDIIQLIDVDVDNARHVDTRIMLEKVLFRYGIVIDSFKHVVDDGRVVFYGTGFKVYKKPLSKFANKRFYKEES